ncbi:hypothetical protein AUC70_05795 [Methyloceanibacter stevinii]|uniref:Rap1a immunity protein domain-containing protein n=1 Tax=Methyloceanibacter stevinii TaxID=1774970 RepID=A0A1E3VNV7_9HYPH|nr:hypothetical protein [Methyloceanibacter stevinii]ODR95210.1 hypothetical protein AUC70_05795 [Methyloceanibacter stevinii]
MLSRKLQLFSSVCTIVCGLSSAGVAAEGEALTSKRFLEYPQTTRDNYISTAAMMAGVIATQNKPPQARCVDQWISKNHDSGFLPVVDAMKKFSDVHPAGVIIAVLTKACGSFKYSD